MSRVEHSASFEKKIVQFYCEKPDRNSKELTLWRRTIATQHQRNRVEARTGYVFIQNGCYVCVALKASSIKGGLLSDFFHFGSNLLKNVSNHAPEHYPP
jgi:hypothetical protein